jgi:hypothetical protein
MVAPIAREAEAKGPRQKLRLLNWPFASKHQNTKDTETEKV